MTTNAGPDSSQQLRQQQMHAALCRDACSRPCWQLLGVCDHVPHTVCTICMRRADAVECIGLYAVVAAGSNPGLLTGAVALLGPLLAAEGSELVRTAAVRALADIALLYGPAAVDAVLRRPAAGGPAARAAAGEEARDGSSGGSSNSSCKGLLELLIDQGQALLSEAQAAGSGSKPGRRVGRWAAGVLWSVKCL